MDLLADFFNDTSFIFVFIVAAAGGLFGGILAGRRASAPSSIVIGAIFGVIASIIASAMNAPSLVSVGGFPLLWAFGTGIVTAYAIGRSTG